MEESQYYIIFLRLFLIGGNEIDKKYDFYITDGNGFLYNLDIYEKDTFVERIKKTIENFNRKGDRKFHYCYFEKNDDFSSFFSKIIRKSLFLSETVGNFNRITELKDWSEIEKIKDLLI